MNPKPSEIWLVDLGLANVQDLGSVPNVRLERKLGQLPNEAMLKIKQALVFALDLTEYTQEE